MREAYLEIAERSFEAGRAIENDFPELAVFFYYHCFESCGGALCSSRGGSYSLNHTTKINQFKTAANRIGIGLNVAVVAGLITPLRNQMLYPDAAGNSPSLLISVIQAQDLGNRVQGILRTVRRHL